jgi:putative flavoprotein involved in K+ transport
MRTTQTLVIGAGQAGLSLSRYLTRAGHDHTVLERGQIGERWRNERWSSLSLLTPNWLNRLPGSPAHADRDGFLYRRAFVDYLERYARSFAAPIVEEAAVLAVEQAWKGFRIATDDGVWQSRNVVIATGDSDVPSIPAISSAAPPGLRQLHGSGYRTPHGLPPGGVLVVGAGPSGQQLALELRQAGRDVVLAVGNHTRVPRRYRGRDIWHWLAELGELDRTIDEVADEDASRRAPSLPLSGANGGEHIDLGVLGDAGVVIAGRLAGFAGSQALFADDLDWTTSEAERRMRRLLARIDQHVEEAGLEAELCPARPVPPVTLPAPPRAIDLAASGFSTVLWATGYRRDYRWLRIPEALDADGELRHTRGVTPVPGLYALGLRFQHKRKSHFIGGVGEDARYLAGCLTGGFCPYVPRRKRAQAPPGAPAVAPA